MDTKGVIILNDDNQEELVGGKYPGRHKDGRFAKGNQLWRLVESKDLKSGAPLKLPTPQIMWEKAVAYFNWANENPVDTGERRGAKGQIKVTKKRVYTLYGLCTHMGISHRRYLDYMDREGYRPVMEMIDQIIKDDKYVGAAAGVYNNLLVIRDLGLVDRKDITSKGDNIAIFELPDDGRNKHLSDGERKE